MGALVRERSRTASVIQHLAPGSRFGERRWDYDRIGLEDI